MVDLANLLADVGYLKPRVVVERVGGIRPNLDELLLAASLCHEALVDPIELVLRFLFSSAQEALLVPRQRLARQLDVVEGPVVHVLERSGVLGPELVDRALHELRDLDAEALMSPEHVSCAARTFRHGGR